MSVSDEFSFSIVRNKMIVLVQFAGRLSPRELSKLEECKLRLQEDPSARFVVLDLTNVLDIPNSQFPEFAKFQKNLRSEIVEIKLCGLSEDLKQKMVRAGIVRNLELASNLQDALKKIQVAKAISSGNSVEADLKKAA